MPASVASLSHAHALCLSLSLSQAHLIHGPLDLLFKHGNVLLLFSVALRPFLCVCVCVCVCDAQAADSCIRGLTYTRARILP